MQLFHGSSSRYILEFNFKHSRNNLDFGRGIYFTTNFEQAKDWSCKYSNEGAVYECDVDLSQFRVLRYQAKERDLLFILYLCRIGLEEIAPDAVDDYDKADVIWGRVLDGNMKDFNALAERFNEGEVLYPEFEKQVELYENGYDQVCIKSREALKRVNAAIKKVYYTRKIRGSTDVVCKMDLWGT